mmetsp:Transcript_10248/g.31573  ORF Transcript_10248/g.31573 Transcript_10248/m.31573 type:complete len:218 (+) Transcript_10248:824-1477(+)
MSGLIGEVLLRLFFLDVGLKPLQNSSLRIIQGGLLLFHDFQQSAIHRRVLRYGNNLRRKSGFREDREQILVHVQRVEILPVLGLVRRPLDKGACYLHKALVQTGVASKGAVERIVRIRGVVVLSGQCGEPGQNGRKHLLVLGKLLAESLHQPRSSVMFQEGGSVRRPLLVDFTPAVVRSVTMSDALRSPRGRRVYVRGDEPFTAFVVRGYIGICVIK